MRLNHDQISERTTIVRAVCNWCDGGELVHTGHSKSTHPLGTPVQHYICSKCGRVEMSYDRLPKTLVRG